ncbi:unnamed protein product, partial [Rotaria sp. Silwood1]
DQLDQSISKTSNNHNTIVNTPSKKYQHNIAIDAIQMVKIKNIFFIR